MCVRNYAYPFLIEVMWQFTNIQIFGVTIKKIKNKIGVFIMAAYDVGMRGIILTIKEILKLLEKIRLCKKENWLNSLSLT